MLEYARASEKQDKVAEALFHRYFEEGKDINSDDVLLEIAKDASLEETGLRNVWITPICKMQSLRRLKLPIEKEYMEYRSSKFLLLV